jgi:uncharacterized protein GlcG (DUF336 family)
VRSQIGAENALAITEDARTHAERLDVRVSIAVVDAGGNLKAFLRMNDAELAGPVLAVDKGHATVAHRTPSHELAELCRGTAVRSALGRRGSLRDLRWGVPIVAGREVIGAVGMTGASVEEDVACAAAAVETTGRRLGLPPLDGAAN